MKVDAKDIFEAFRMFQAFKDPKVKERKTPEKKEKNFFEAFQEFKAQHDAFEQWKKDQEKLNKKEEKKDDKSWNGLSTDRWVGLLIALSPITGLFWYQIFQKLFH